MYTAMDGHERNKMSVQNRTAWGGMANAVFVKYLFTQFL